MYEFISNRGTYEKEELKITASDLFYTTSYTHNYSLLDFWVVDSSRVFKSSPTLSVSEIKQYRQLIAQNKTTNTSMSYNLASNSSTLNSYVDTKFYNYQKMYVVVSSKKLPSSSTNDYINISPKIKLQAEYSVFNTFKVVNESDLTIVSTDSDKFIVNGQLQSTTSTQTGLLPINSEHTVKPLHNQFNNRRQKNWDFANQKFYYEKDFENTLTNKELSHKAVFTPTFDLTISVGNLEGAKPAFSFQDPWLLEPDEVTQLNTPKTYLIDTTFQVFNGTNILKDLQSTQPTYLFKEPATPQLLGVTFFLSEQTSTNLQFHQAQNPSDKIVTFTGNASITRTYKAHNHSNTSSVVGLDNRRLVAEHLLEQLAYRVYESTGKIWLQHRELNATNWSNEVQVLVQLGEESIDILRNPRLVYAEGFLWVISEAYDSGVWDTWFYTATVIDNPSPPQRQFISTAVWLPGYHYYTPLSVAGQFAAAGAVNTGSSQVALTWKPTTSNVLTTSVLRFSNAINPENDTILQTDVTGTQPTTVTVSTGLDIAMNGNTVGIAFVSGSTLTYREAEMPNLTTLTWNSSAHRTLTSSYVAHAHTPSIIPWRAGTTEAFRVTFTGQVFTTGSPYSVIWRTVGNGTSDNTYKYVFFYTRVFNQFEGVQAGRVNVTGNPSSTGQFAFSVKHLDTWYNTTNLKSFRFTSESSSGSQTSFSLRQTSTTNRSVAATTSASTHLGVFKSANQGLQKLNEVQAPIVAKGKTESDESVFFSAQAIHYKTKAEQELFELFLIESIYVGNEAVTQAAYTQDSDYTYLTEPFEWNSTLFLSAYSSDEGRLPFNLVLLDENDTEVASVQARGENMKAFFEIGGDKLRQTQKTIAAFSAGSGEKVRLAVKKQSTLAEIQVAELFIPELQEVSASAQLSDISDWTQQELPTEIGLQAYPNPFNPTTTVQLALPSASAVTVQVYDVTGRLVSELFSGEKQAGVHEFGFNASKLSSGTYFVRLQYQSANGSPQFVSKAITLIK